MDKEAQERIAKVLHYYEQTYHTCWDWENLSPAERNSFVKEADRILEIIEQLGYRKPPEGKPPFSVGFVDK